MMKLKKILTILLVIIACLTILCACGEDDENGVQSQESSGVEDSLPDNSVNSLSSDTQKENTDTSSSQNEDGDTSDSTTVESDLNSEESANNDDNSTNDLWTDNKQ